jgi:apolipoprotein N-acyltransferase
MSSGLEIALKELEAERPSVFARAWSTVLALWGGFIGLLPHVLHHVGPLAGAALLAGATGTVLFAAIGFVAAAPFLLRVYRRFGTWRAPAIALAIFAAMFSLSSFVIGPTVSDRGDPVTKPGIEQPAGHAAHH